MIQGGANLDVRDNDGKNALNHAEELMLPEMCILLQNCVESREHLVEMNEARRLFDEKEARKAARRAELSDSEFDFTSDDDDDD